MSGCRRVARVRRMFVATAIVMICVAVGASAAVKKYGKDLTLKETTKISDIYAKTEAFDGKRVKVRGAIVDVCEMNQMHLNTPKRLWTVVADVYAVGLIVLAITGMFVGKTGITGRGAWLTGAGVLLPVAYWVFHLYLE